MTGIVEFKTKKEMKEAVDKGLNFWIVNPGPFGDETFQPSDMEEGRMVTVTNHPKRSWFASLKKVDGIIKVK